MIATEVDGFLSLGQPTARRIARRRGLTATLLVHGPSGSGKKAFVDDLLAMAFCTDADAGRRPCNACRGCRDARSRSHPDLVVGSPELWRERRSTGETIVSVARRWLLEAAGAPVVASRRIVLIEHADGSNEQVQNAMLKALEEPTDRHTFILVADEPTRLLPTIRSRCQPLRIGPVPRAELVAFLMDRHSLPADQAETLARLANGHAGTAIRYVDRTDLLDWRRRVQSQLLALLDSGRAERFGEVADLLDDAARLHALAPPPEDDEAEGSRTPGSVQRAAATLVVGAWLDLTRDLIVASAARPELAPGTELGPELVRAGERIGPAALADMARLLERIHDGLGENAAPRLALERAMLAWPQPQR